MNHQQSTQTQYNSFYLNDLLFGIEISYVKEIIRNHKISYVPRAPAYIQGVINLRGSIVTVMDPKIKLGMSGEPADPAKDRIIIIKSPRSGEDYIGLLADRISDVHAAGQADMQDDLLHLTDVERRFIKQVCKLENELLLILNRDNLLAQG